MTTQPEPTNLEVINYYCTTSLPTTNCECNNRTNKKNACTHLTAALKTVGIKYKCQCGVERYVKGSGYTNIMQHIKKEHPDYLKITRDALNSTGQKLITSLFSNRGANMFEWMKYIIRNYYPCSHIDDRENQKLMKLMPITGRTLKKYIYDTTKEVEKAIANVLPDYFGIVMDAWSNGSTHYIAIFASFEVDGKLEMVMLAMTPPFDEESFDAQTQYDLIGDTLHIYKKNKDNIAYLVADNAAVNVKTAGPTLLDVPFIGCASHKWNLAVQNEMKKLETSLSVCPI